MPATNCPLRRAMCISVALCIAVAVPTRALAQPNFLFIAIDDLNDWVGPLGGHPQVQTPHMDRLAEQGTVFTNAHCQAPICNPSRTSLMTGLRPSTTGVYAILPWFREVDRYRDLVTLPQYLQRHGYTTYMAGKIHHGDFGREGQEFDVIGPKTTVGVKPEERLVEDTVSPHPLVDWGTFPHGDEDRGDWSIASWAVDQLSGEMPEPFFLSVGFFLPHVPCYAPPKWFDLYPEDTLKLPEIRRDDREDTPLFSWFLHWRLSEVRLKFLEETNQWKNLVRSYLASISYVDSQVGRVLDAFENSDYKEDTVVVLWSDHGWHLGEKLITGKNTLWERSTRVPLIFAGPGINAGAECGHPAELLDLYPTFVDLAGLPAKAELEGHSLAPQLKDPDAPREWPAITTHNHDNHAVRSQDWRYIQYADGSEELYDMRNDPAEWTNLAGDEGYAGVIKEHRRWLPKLNAPPVPGSAVRILTYRDGQANWEGEDIKPGDPIPEL